MFKIFIQLFMIISRLQSDKYNHTDKNKKTKTVRKLCTVYGRLAKTSYLYIYFYIIVKKYIIYT